MIDKFDKRTRALLIVIMYNIIFTNDVATSYVFSTLEELEKLPMYKGAIKRNANIVHRYLRDYNAKMGKRIKELAYFLADINDELESQLSIDLMKLENAVRMELSRCHVPNIDMATKMSVAYTMCDVAVSNCDAAIDTQEQKIRFYASPLRKYKIENITKSFYKLCKLIQKENDKLADYHCDLTNKTDVANGFLIIVQKLKNGEFILDILNKIDKDKEFGE